MDEGNRKSLSEVMHKLKEIPYKPKPIGGRMSTSLGSWTDVIPMFLDTQRKTSGFLYPYPRSFQSVTFPSHDDTPLAGKMALHKDGKARPGLVFCPGIFGSKSHNLVRKVAIKAFKHWDYNVLAIDPRGSGESRRLSDAEATGGWKEAEDIIGAARYLGSFAEVTTVGVSAYSMGGASALIASAVDGGEFITGGVIAWNGYADAKRMVDFISKPPKFWQPFYLVYPVFKTCLELSKRARGKSVNAQVRDFADFISYACSGYYCMPEDEVYYKSSPKNYLDDIKIPTLHIHSKDDPVIPVLEAEENLRLSADNPNVDVWIVKRGGHCTFDTVDKNWYETVLQDFFAAWAVR